jgi:hypothetical protein
MSWHVYEISPVDLNWEFLPSVESVAKNLASMHAEMAVSYGKASFPALSYEEFIDLWTSAQDAARAEGWAGDHREIPRVLWLPIDDAFRPGFAIKQDSNGVTYVVSPVILPHLTVWSY